jgi:hypothetical protein
VSAAPSKALAVTMPPVPVSPEPVVTRPAAMVTAGPVPEGLLSRALQAQFLVGNTAVAAWLLGVPPGGVPPGGVGPPGLAGPGPPGTAGSVTVADGPAGQSPVPAGPASGGGLSGVPGLAPPGTAPIPGRAVSPPVVPPAAGAVAGAGSPAGGVSPAGTAFTQAAAPVAAPAATTPDTGAPAPAGPVAAAPGAAGPRAAAMPARPKAEHDPKFAVLKLDVHTKGRHVSASHPPPKSEAGSAQGAAKPPADDKVAQGKVANAEKMNDAKPKTFDKTAFIKAVRQAIAAQAPKNLKEADQFADSDKPAQVKKDVQGQVDQGKQDSAQGIATTTAAPPDTSKAVTKQVVPMAPDRPPGAPATPDPANAVPNKLRPSATDLSAGPRKIDAQMADAHVTEPQLARSNEPTFTAAVQDKHQLEQDSAQATPAMRAHEAATLKTATADAQHQGAAGMHQLAGARVAAGQKVTAGKQGAKAGDEAKRAEVTGTLQRVFDATKKDVEDILSGLDKKVDDKFSTEEKAARDAFTAEHKRRMKQYKHRRYAGLAGKARWFHDWLLDLPNDANLIFVEARDHYILRMQTVISDVADLIGAELDRAKARIATGRSDLQQAVKKLPADLRAIGARAASDFAGKFDELNESVDAKNNDLVQTLATKYNDALTSVDDEIAKEKEPNKGFLHKTADKVKGVINTIMELKNLLLGVLRKAASAVMLILNDPIGFLKNLVGAVGAGLKQFLRNIVKHLEQGLVSWLLGVTTQAGLTLPKSFDVKGILMLIAGLLGLTWQFVRSRIVRKIPEKVVAAVETGVTLITKIRQEGIAGLWDEIKTQIGDLKHTLISKVTEYLIPTIIVAGIMWVLSLLNPASAFVRACKLIIDIIQFIVERGRQIIDFVNAVLDAVIAIAKGGTGGVPSLIENALARSIPVLIGFLASLLGIGGVADKVKKIFQTLSKPVAKAIDWVIDKIVGLVKKLWAKLKDRFGKGKDPDNNKASDKALVPPHKVFQNADHERHELLFANEDPRAPLMVRSDPVAVGKYLDDWEKETASVAQKPPGIARARTLLAEINARKAQLEAGASAAQVTYKLVLNKLNELAAALAERGSPAGDPPPPLLPAFVNGVLATGFKARFIPENIPRGTESDANKGSTLHGWKYLEDNDYGKVHPKSWAKMHLLPAFLGGMATDSNLVPARNFVNNPLFLKAAENPARKALTSKTEKVIWYKVDVSFYAEPHGFPSRIEVQWGGYDPTGGRWEEKPAGGGFSDREDRPLPPEADVLRVNVSKSTFVARHLGASTADAKKISDEMHAVRPRTITAAVQVLVKMGLGKYVANLQALYRQGRLRFY